MQMICTTVNAGDTYTTIYADDIVQLMQVIHTTVNAGGIYILQLARLFQWSYITQKYGYPFIRHFGPWPSKSFEMYTNIANIAQRTSIMAPQFDSPNYSKCWDASCISQWSLQS